MKPQVRKNKTGLMGSATQPHKNRVKYTRKAKHKKEY